MNRSEPSLVGLAVLGLCFSVLLTGCRGEAPTPPEAVPGASLDSVSLTVEGMT